MKNKIKLILIISLLVVLFGCKNKSVVSTSSDVVFFRNYLDNEATDYFDTIQNNTSEYAKKYEMSFTTYKLKGISEKTFVDSVNLAQSSGCKLIVLTYDYQEVLSKTYNQFPNITFLIFDVNLQFDANNVTSTYFDYSQIGYITGTLAVYYNLKNFTFIDKLEDINSHDLFVSLVQGVSDKATSTCSINYYSASKKNDDEINKIIYQQLLTDEDTAISFGEGVDVLLNKYCQNTGLSFIGIGFENAINYDFYVFLRYETVFDSVFKDYKNASLISGSLSYGIKEKAIEVKFSEDTSFEVKDVYDNLYLNYVNGNLPKITSNAFNSLNLPNVKVVINND